MKDLMKDRGIFLPSILLPTLGFGFLSISSTFATEQVIASDPFTDGILYRSPACDPLGLVWFQSIQTTPALDILDGAGGLGDGKALHYKADKDYSTITAHFPEVPLTAEGDRLTVEFDYRLPTGLANVGGGLRMGLYDSAGTLRTTDTQIEVCSDDQGYGFSTNAGGTQGTRDSGCFREVPGNSVLGGPAPAGIQDASNNKRGPALSADGVKHHLRLVLKRAAAGALEMVCTQDDRELASMSEPADKLLTTQFDEFALGWAGTNNHGEITLDNVKITALTQQPLASMKSAPDAAAAPVLREWTNQQGRVIKATLLAFNASSATVKIQLESGQEFTLPLSSLSAADVAYVQKAAKALPEAATAWKPHYPEPLKKTAAKLASGRSLLKNLRPGHPRLMMHQEDWPVLKDIVASDPIASILRAQVTTLGTQMLDDPPLEHVLSDGVRLLPTSRALVGRVYTLGVLSRLDGDPKWATRAIKELMNVCSFKDWNPSHFLDVAEMAHGVGVGFDWFYDQLSENERATICKALVEMAFKPALEVYAQPKGWHRGEHLNNWNHVCNGGLLTAALAVAEKEPRYVGQILDAAMESLEPAMNLYLPDGAWDEGPSYWVYATNYVITAAEALRTATGSDGGIVQSPALNLAAEFMQHAMGGTRMSFNFADAGAEHIHCAAFLWLGRTYNRPDYSSMLKGHVLRSGATGKASSWFGAPHALLWFHRNSGTEEWQKAPLDRVFRRIEMVSLRTGWDDDAFSISVKGGNNRFSHGHLDLGTFVIDGVGVRWARDLGGDNYSLVGYFGKERFTHYRTSSAGQNVLTWEDKNQELDGTGFIESFLSTQERGQAVLDLSKGYTNAKRVRRGVRLQRGANPSILLQDEVTRPQKGPLVWAMHTQAVVENPNGDGIILTTSGRKMKVALLAPAGAKFEVVNVNLEPPAYPTPNTRKLMLRIPNTDAKSVTIAVHFSHISDMTPAPKVEPLDTWGGQPVPR